MKVTKIQHIF